MRELLKKMRGYLIYNSFFFLMLLLGYCLEPGRFVGQDCDWIWLWLVVAYWVSMFEVFLAGPAFALFYQMYQFTVKEIFWSALIILVSTFLSLSVMDLLFNGWEGILMELLFALGVSLWISGTYTVVYFILRSICKKTRMG
ncbi:hypothetical protein B5F98_11415 [Pseudoflavonifractor sp. An44]|uniref:hypothetical protein n=1 Tax=Pseudoflavonifractor sp. An44 TaxID=1965635 RepID=UPI000B3A0254|nr:hypothetical protein [Pseudoflavonifractor sp. An44]OUN92435.1 hypothetical protein B5F98_11415 [Pseudoflavonifractor sp. An44]